MQADHGLGPPLPPRPGVYCPDTFFPWRGPVNSPRQCFLDHDDFGLNQAKIINVIDSKCLERDAGAKPGSTFPHPALEAH
jgi:hypothetical protein